MTKMDKVKVDIDKYKYAKMFKRFVGQTNPCVCASGCFDITNLYNRKSEHKLNAMLCYCIQEAGQGIEEFHYIIDENHNLYYYKNVKTNAVVNGVDGTLYWPDFKYCKKFEDFEKEYNEKTEYSRTHCTHVKDVPGALLSTSAIVNYPFTSFIIGKSDDFWDNFLMWGKYIIEGDKVKLNITLRFHHAVIDGEHAGMFFKELQRQFDIFDC